MELGPTVWYLVLLRVYPGLANARCNFPYCTTTTSSSTSTSRPTVGKEQKNKSMLLYSILNTYITRSCFVDLNYRYSKLRCSAIWYCPCYSVWLFLWDKKSNAVEQDFTKRLQNDFSLLFQRELYLLVSLHLTHKRSIRNEFLLSLISLIF